VSKSDEADPVEQWYSSGSAKRHITK